MEHEPARAGRQAGTSEARRTAVTLEWRGLKAYQLAAAIGREKSAVSNWVHGRETPSYPEVHAMARVLDVPVELLWDHGVPVVLSPPAPHREG